MSKVAARSTLLKSALCLLLLATGAARAQTVEQTVEPPRLKRESGESRERLKREAEQQKAAKGEGGVEEDEVVRVETSLVVSDVLVLDQQGHVVRGLAREDFLITEDGRAQEVGMFSLGNSADVPRSIVLILDYSGSMAPFLENSIEAAKTLVSQMAPRDRMAIVTDDVELLADFTGDKKLLSKKLEKLGQKAGSENSPYNKRYGRSQQYSALLATLGELFDAEDVRPIIIFQTDGDQLRVMRDSPVPAPGPASHKWNPGFSIADVYRAAERSRATVYTVIPGIRLIGLKPGEQAAKERQLRATFDPPYLSGPASSSRAARQAEEVRERMLDDIVWAVPPQQTALYGLSKLTGGWTSFLERPSQAADIYAGILSDIGLRYVVGFYPTNKERDGKRRRVQIEVRGHPEYSVWGRKSYYAPKP